MPILKIISLSIILTAYFSLGSNILAADGPLETIIYDVSPVLGISEYQDFGLVEFQGNKANLVTFKTKVAGFKDTETIYSNPDTYLPIRVERNISSMWLHKEYIVEEYFSQESTLKIDKFEGGKKTKEYNFKGKGPINNAILLPFSLRKVPNLGIGWSCEIILPEVFRVRLVNIEDVTVPAGKFRAYHFTSSPPKFEIWISADDSRIPVKIKGLGGLSYTLSMKKRILKEEK